MPRYRTPADGTETEASARCHECHFFVVVILIAIDVSVVAEYAQCQTRGGFGATDRRAGDRCDKYTGRDRWETEREKRGINHRDERTSMHADKGQRGGEEGKRKGKGNGEG